MGGSHQPWALNPTATQRGGTSHPARQTNPECLHRALQSDLSDRSPRRLCPRNPQRLSPNDRRLAVSLQLPPSTSCPRRAFARSYALEHSPTPSTSSCLKKRGRFKSCKYFFNRCPAGSDVIKSRSENHGGCIISKLRRWLCASIPFCSGYLAWPQETHCAAGHLI